MRRFTMRTKEKSKATATINRAANRHRVVPREEWPRDRKAHLKSEKALTRLRDLVAAERRALPWVKVHEEYRFDTPEGEKTLADLFEGVVS